MEEVSGIEGAEVIKSRSSLLWKSSEAEVRANGEFQTGNGELRTGNGEGRTENGERRTANTKRKKTSGL